MRISRVQPIALYFALFLMLGLLPPACLKQNLVMDKVFDLLKLISFLTISFIYIMDFKVHVKKGFNWILFFLWGELLVSTIISENANLHSYITVIASISGMVMLAEEFVVSNPYVGLKSFYVYFSACTFINTTTVFLFPGAMYANNRGLRVCWFLGEDNGGYAYYIMACICAMLYCYYIAKRITVLSILIWINSFVFVFYRDIVTGIICQSAFLFLFIMSRHRWFQKMLKASYAFYITFWGFIFLVITRKLLIESIITAFNRRVTLGRTEIWDRVLEAIKHAPIFGYGVCSGEQFNNIFSVSILGPHNYSLNLLFWGGIFAAGIFGVLMLSSYWSSLEVKTTCYCQYLVVGLIVFSIRFLVETGNVQFMYMLLAMLAYSKEFLENINEEDYLESTPLFEVIGIPKIKLSFRRSMK